MFDFRRINFPILLLSFSLSILLWMHVKSLTENSEVRPGPSSFTVSLELRNQPAGTVVVGDVPTNVTFTASGDLNEIRKIDANYLKAFVDLSTKPVDGRYKVVLETTADAEVKWSPDRWIPVNLEPEVTSRVTVSIEPIGDFTLTDYRYDGATSDPTTITVTGAKSVVERVKRARAYLNLGALASDYTQRAKVEVLDDKDTPVSDVALSTETVTLRATVAAKPPRRSLLIQPVWNGTPEMGSTVIDYEFTPAQVTVEGPADVLANLSVLNTKPINIEGIKETSTIQVELDLPQGIRLTNPGKVEVKVFVKGAGPAPPATTGGR